MSYSGTLTPYPADSEQSSLVKIAASAGADVSGGESPYTLWRKIVLALGGTVTGAENEHTLIYKAGKLWGADVNQAMFPQVILNRAAVALGGDVSGSESMQRILFEIASATNSGSGSEDSNEFRLLYGNPIDSNFADASDTSSKYDLTLANRIQVGGAWGIQASNLLAGVGGARPTSYLITKVVQSDQEVLIRFKNISDPEFSFARMPLPLLRVGNTSTYWASSKEPDDGGRTIIYELVGGTLTVNKGYTPSPLPAMNDTANDYFMRWRVIGDFYQYRCWLSNTPEPETWSRSERMDITANFLQSGKVGCGFFITAGLLLQISQKEITRGDTNLIVNNNFTLYTDASAIVPTYWTAQAHASVEEIEDHLGVTRKAFLIDAPAGGTYGDPSNALWVQDLYTSGVGGTVWAPGVAIKFPQAQFPLTEYVDISFWTKGENVISSNPVAGTLGASFVMYQYGGDGTALNIPPLGGEYQYAFNAAGGTMGQGTWGWQKTTHRMRMSNLAETVHLAISMGIHDANVSGKVWITDPVITVVP